MDRQVAEIASEPDRAAAYARLLLLQRGCADDASSAAELAAELPSTLLPLLLRDAAADDEAVAASALKCLGFALYHPVLVYTISGYHEAWWSKSQKNEGPIKLVGSTSIPETLKC